MLEDILSSEATSYILKFGGLGVVLNLALNTLHKYFKLKDKVWGFMLIALGGCGGVLLQGGGLVELPGGSLTASTTLAAFVGAMCAAAAAGFSAVDLRAMVAPKDKKTEE